MNVATFHLNLLGKDRDGTPEKYWLTPRHQELYTRSESGLRGFSGSGTEEEFLATLVLALSQTHSAEGSQRVLLIVPKTKQKWVMAQIKETARYIFRCRRGNPEAVKVLRRAFQQLSLCERPNAAPSNLGWVFFGFSDTRLPLWAKGQLIG